jgi:C4-dicarboxylate-specific signal transduction histidine kinase/ActR/RegA family two-component response regulator
MAETQQQYSDEAEEAGTVGPPAWWRPRTWVNRPCFDVSASKKRIALLLVASGLLESTGRLMFHADLITSTTRDMLGLSGLGLLLVSAFYVFTLVHSIQTVWRVLVCGLAVLVLFQISDVIDEFAIFDDVPLLGREQPLHQFLEHSLVVLGGLLIAAGFSFALLEGEVARRRLDIEREWLQENIVERRRAELALKESRDQLEEEVSARTAELAERNAQLQRELAVRQAAEDRLAGRLRYEEGLAACSQTLLAEASTDEALRKALAHLLKASEAARVYLFENEEVPEEGLCMHLTHETWDTVKCPECRVSATPMRLAYARGYLRWLTELNAGRAIVGAMSSFPEEEQPALIQFNVASVVLLPIHWGGKWRGFIGLDDIDAKREWRPEEVRMLRTAAEMIGAYRERQEAEIALRNTYDSLERRVDERTADLMRTNEHLKREVIDRKKAESDKLRLESRLRQAQKMQAIGTLAGGIAHDFNNILSSIIGYTEMAITKMPPGTPIGRYLDEVYNAGNRAKELVRQILVFSRQSEQQRQPVLISEVAQEVITLLEAACPENIRLESEISEDAGMVLSDHVQLHQVLMNLCTNAQHAMKGLGGTLTIGVSHHQILEEVRTLHVTLPPGEYVRMSVSDTGHGMTPDVLDRIYEPFFTTKSVGEGTGMGLAIVHGIVTGQGGGIIAESELGKGTTFAVYLPHFDGAAPVVLKRADKRLLGHEHIMVVDDEGQIVSLWSELLRDFGYRVTAFTRSLDALDAFTRDPDRYDLVLLDQTMPQMTGAELAVRILEKRPGLPIILATGFSESINADDAREIGIHKFILKPIIARELAAAIREALDQTRPALTQPAAE